MKTIKYALIPIVGLAALATADDIRRQDTRLFSIPPQPTAPDTTPGRLSILPVSLPSASASASPAPTTIGHITGSAPPPNGTIVTVTTPTSGASQTTTSGSGSGSGSASASSSTTTSGSKAGPSTGTQSQTSNPAAAPTVANYVAGLAALVGLAVAM
ncbi:hypothetical protein C2857_001387 [Epichloe festucae Fl1]|uniref:Uncharacterized protein n=1 Tax=Epichloe festucae (strain Fl1) TaxID=877507 RepID=A0A7S9KRH3_EPIFF|nr:hypothetical protein C2857_001387 [Epichloe festucae Fl1]